MLCPVIPSGLPAVARERLTEPGSRGVPPPAAATLPDCRIGSFSSFRSNSRNSPTGLHFSERRWAVTSGCRRSGWRG